MSSEFVSVTTTQALRQLMFDGEFGPIGISRSQHQFKSSSTALIAITFILFIGYSVAKFIANNKTNYGLDVRNTSIHINFPIENLRSATSH